MNEAPITFLFPFPERLLTAEAIDPDAATSGFNLGSEIWILQTYLRLKGAGCDVRISAELPASGVVVFHTNPPSMELLETQGAWRRRELILLVVCADRIRFPPGDLYILQNDRYLDHPNTVFVPHWPQPGLLRRRPERDERLERLSYKGYSLHLHEMFRSERWHRGLAELGISWVPDAVEMEVEDPADLSRRWSDYSEVDAVLAVRVDLTNAWTNKPASKLVNAWLAGTPALLGPEYPYRQLRQSPLDYFEVCNVDEALSAVARLKSEPGLYKAMVENGRQRAAEFCAERVTRIWQELLFATVRARVASGELPVQKRAPWDLSPDFPGWQSATYPTRLM